MTRTRNFENTERTSATISGVGDPEFPAVLRPFKFLSYGVHGPAVVENN